MLLFGRPPGTPGGPDAAVTAEPLPQPVKVGAESLPCSVEQAEAALVADGAFLDELKVAMGGSNVAVGEWTNMAGAGGRVRECTLVQAVRSELSPVRETCAAHLERWLRGILSPS